jgi:hypothetical protein
MPAAPYPAKPAIYSLERPFSLKAEGFLLKRPSGFLHEKSICCQKPAVNCLKVTNATASWIWDKIVARKFQSL